MGGHWSHPNLCPRTYRAVWFESPNEIMPHWLIPHSNSRKPIYVPTHSARKRWTNLFVLPRNQAQANIWANSFCKKTPDEPIRFAAEPGLHGAKHETKYIINCLVQLVHYVLITLIPCIFLNFVSNADLNSNEAEVAKQYPAHTAICIRDGWEFCSPELAAGMVLLEMKTICWPFLFIIIKNDFSTYFFKTIVWLEPYSFWVLDCHIGCVYMDMCQL